MAASSERSYRAPGVMLTEREHEVPLDHADAGGPRLTVFTREVAAPDGGDRPYLVFLQGGPGFEAARPTSPPSGWMKRAAGILAEHLWPALYDAEQLRHNEVPVAATIYVNDLYVERDFAEETAASIRGLRTWQTDEFEHNSLRADGERVLGRLIDLVRGRA